MYVYLKELYPEPGTGDLKRGDVLSVFIVRIDSLEFVADRVIATLREKIAAKPWEYRVNSVIKVDGRLFKVTEIVNPIFEVGRTYVGKHLTITITGCTDGWFVTTYTYVISGELGEWHGPEWWLKVLLRWG